MSATSPSSSASAPKPKVPLSWILFGNRWMAGSTILLVLLVVAAVVGPFLTGYAPETTSGAQFLPPCRAHWFGTDLHGRDLLTRILCGARLSLLVGLVGAGVSLVIGVAYGAISGYAGGRTDNAMMRIVDIIASLPTLIFIILLIAVLEKPLTQTFSGVWKTEARIVLLFVGIGCFEWLTMARIVRGQVLVLKELSFVQAARTLGQSPFKIVFRHLVPNLLGIVIVYLTLSIPSVILQESFLSFLGLGVQAPAASLGSLMAEGVQVINPLRVSWWLLVFPGSFMAATLMALNFLGDGLRDILDPKSVR
ncbi:peptide/nickel transport system permease protein/oligopeptide transport system permease protein [Verrucomicrobium sp. GAS474]|uniref:ABC transporter permease n=1 Tax=Verrucomicrobium sp. GAS474 TaxID=1882831 RepID=UPI00087BB232|nr:ABC transporter permease [Verrucomicrobium sp. GAS474]SDU21517.1 peptide/nickel transport system permease protein/oligopeptide transport system permease protein [Verrucomicrobium sp. GAS474]